MKLDFDFSCDQLISTNHSLLPEVSSSASCQHILTMCIRSCTYMDKLPLKAHCQECDWLNLQVKSTTTDLVGLYSSMPYVLESCILSGMKGVRSQS